MKQRAFALTLSLGLVLMFSSLASAQYKLTKLTSNQSGVATYTDPLLVNGWGLTYGPGGPFWVSDNGDGWSTLYNSTGQPQTTQVIVPSANGISAGTPTGIVYNGSTQFQIDGWTSVFLFDTLDGTISGWSEFSPSASIIAVDNSASGAIYTGLAITNYASNNYIFAADSWNNKVDIYDGNFNFVSSFTDPSLPAGFTPFGIQDIGGSVYVTFASTSGGPGGYVDIFSEQGKLIKRLVHGSPLNQPWGLAMAPKNFGPLSNALLVGNNINFSSTINAFNATTGKFMGTISTSAGKAIKIDQLWGIEFGGGSTSNGKTNQLFFTAGPSNNVNGLFGVISYK
ncbi:MAG TPA: TIGR03118 family protein [Terriglobia bacterium]|nr:TIGR03118 family protein [Terriglobia bacterium]